MNSIAVDVIQKLATTSASDTTITLSIHERIFHVILLIPTIMAILSLSGVLVLILSSFRPINLLIAQYGTPWGKKVKTYLLGILIFLMLVFIGFVVASNLILLIKYFKNLAGVSQVISHTPTGELFADYRFRRILFMELALSIEGTLLLMLFQELLNHGFYLLRNIRKGFTGIINPAEHQIRKFIVKFEEKNGKEYPVAIKLHKKVSNTLPSKYEKLNKETNSNGNEKSNKPYTIMEFPVASAPQHPLVWNSSYVLFFMGLVVAISATPPIWLSGFTLHDALAIASVWIVWWITLIVWSFDIFVLNSLIGRMIFGEILNWFTEIGKRRILQISDFLETDRRANEIFALPDYVGAPNPFVSLPGLQVHFDILYMTPTTINIYKDSMFNARFYAFKNSLEFMLIPFENVAAIEFESRKLRIRTFSNTAYEYSAGTAVAARTATILADRLREKYRQAHLKISTMHYEEALEYLDKLVNYEKRSMPRTPPNLDEFREFLAKIGNPHLAMKNPILIVGTKGKGSTAAHLAAILASYGYKVGLYTSPHIRQPLERIRIVQKKGGKISFDEIAADEFAYYISRIHRYIPRRGGMRTYFELLTAMAFLYFQENNVDYSIIEAGLGGKYDATNVIQQALTVITPISYDHVHILGPELTDIVEQKVDVIKKHKNFPIVRIVVGNQIGQKVASPDGEKEVEPRKVVFEGIARKIKQLWDKDPELNFRVGLLFDQQEIEGEEMSTFSRIFDKYGLTELAAQRTGQIQFYLARYDYSGLVPASSDGIIPATEFRFESPWQEIFTFKSGLAGRYQAHNASLAALAAYVFDLPRKKNAGIKGVDGVTPECMPGRFQILRKYDPLTIVDGAHNSFAVREFLGALKEYIEKIAAKDGKYSLFFVFGANEDKDYRSMLRNILESGLSLKKFYFTRSSLARAEKPQKLLETAASILRTMRISSWRKEGPEMEAIEDAREAFDRAFDDAVAYEEQSKGKGIVVITGSFYLVGEAIEWNYEFSADLP